MKSIAKLQVFLALISIAVCGEIVETEDGFIEGTTLQSRKGVEIHAFYKIPYAKPPINELRFQAPVKNDKWEETLNATEPGPICVQFTQMGPQSEDCLHLNVYSKDLKPAALKPVIVFIHGGGFEMGSGVEQEPFILLDRDVVFVTLNYRLNVFGFLALGTENAVGNMGLKDQALAIQWISRNIENFGGNPEIITLAGSSAGAHSTTAHMVSDMTKNLIHRVIASSGSITWQKGLQNDNIERAQDLAAALNCSIDIYQMVECLKEKDAGEIATAARYQWHSCPLMPFAPVLEPDFGQERFFKAQPNELFKSGNFSRIPLMIGITSDEFIQSAVNILANETSVAELNENFADFTSKCFIYDANGIQTREQMAESLRNLYFPFDKIDSRSVSGLNELCADGTIGYGVHRLAHYATNFTDVYYYKFSYRGQNSIFNYPSNKPYGVHHGDDLQYTVSAAFIAPMIKLDDPDNVMVEKMSRVWEQFAWRGNPNNSTDEYLSEMNWPKHDYENEYYLDIGPNFIEKQGLYLKRFITWDNFENEISASKIIQITFFVMLVSLISHLVL